jgi:uncharacterized membrane protein
MNQLRINNYELKNKKAARRILSATLKHSLLSLSLLIVLLVGLSALVPVSVEAQNATEVCEQIRAVDPSASCSAGDTRLNTTMENVIGIMSYAIGVISVIVILIGAIMYAASTGDPQKTKRAQDAILYAIVGLVVAVLGQAIVRTVLGGLE